MVRKVYVSIAKYAKIQEYLVGWVYDALNTDIWWKLFKYFQIHIQHVLIPVVHERLRNPISSCILNKETIRVDPTVRHCLNFTKFKIYGSLFRRRKPTVKPFYIAIVTKFTEKAAKIMYFLLCKGMLLFNYTYSLISSQFHIYNESL